MLKSRSPVPQTSHNIWLKLDRYPPVVCRLLATDNGRLLTDTELSLKAGLTMADIRHLSHSTR